MKIERRLFEKYPHGDLEIWITDVGKIEVLRESDGYQWRFTGKGRFPFSNDKRYSSSGAAFEAAREMLESD